MARPTDSDSDPDDTIETAPSTAIAIPVTVDGKRRIGKYEIQKKIGAGGMGAVFLALDPGLKRSVALKVLPKDKADNPVLVKRFKVEAQAAANLRHENIVTVYEAGEADGFLYMAMEFVDGTDVANMVIKRGPMPVKRSVQIVRQVAQALQHAYKQQIVHRDIKPGNLLVGRDGTVKLADLGLARVVDEHLDTSITRAGTTVGTVDYMSPEQARNSKAADVRSDIYSLGCTWYFMLTGRAPFAEGSLTNKLRSHAEEPMPDPRQENPAVSEAVYAVMRRMGAKDPTQRYQTPAELIQDLDETNFSDDVFSQVILDELDEEASSPSRARPRELDDTAAPGEKIAAGRKPSRVREKPPTGRFRPPREDGAEAETDWGRAIMYYGVLAVLAVAVIGGLTLLIRGFSSSDVSGQPTTKPGPETVVVDSRSADDIRVGQTAPETTQIGGAPQGESSDPNTLRFGPGETAESTGSPALPPRSAQSLPDVTKIGPGGLVSSTGGQGTTGPSVGSSGSAQSLASSWNGAESSTAGLPVLNVKLRGAGAGEFDSLNAALAHAPAAGAVLMLHGPGPFPLRAVRLENRRQIVIQPAIAGSSPSAAPLVVLALEPGATEGLLVAGATLELRRIHLAVDAGPESGSAGNSLIHVAAGELLVRDCSISARGRGGPGLSAVKVAPRSDMRGENASGTRVLLERTLVRGNSLTALRLEGPADVILRDSLLWSGSSPAISLAGSAADDRGCLVRVLSSTVCSQACAVSLSGDAERPLAASFDWRDSLAAAPESGRETALVRFDGWSQTQTQQAAGRSAAWTSAGTLYTGWKALAAIGPAGLALASNAADWNALWKNSVGARPEQIQATPWPAGPLPEDVLALPLERLEPSSLGTQYVKASSGGWPGCRPELVPAPSLSSLDAGAVAARRPAWPGELFAEGAAQTIRIDLNAPNVDLGKVLAARNLQTGTQIVVSGTGVKPSSPIVIRDISVRIRFEQSDSAPLVLSPVLPAARAGDPFITVQNGGLTLEKVAISPQRAESAPGCFIQVIDGDLALRSCRLQGPMVDVPRHRGLIEWVRRKGPGPRHAGDQVAGEYLACDGCYLVDSGTLIKADISQRALLIRDSVLVSREDALVLALDGVDARGGGVVDLETSTLSAAGSFVHVTAASLTNPTDVPLAAFADRCVFGPPLRPSQKNGPVLLSWRGPLLETRQIAWYENRCGYATDFIAFARADAGAAPQGTPDFDQHWRSLWPREQVIEPLTGVQGIVLATKLPQSSAERAKLEPENFALDPQCRGATWAAGQPIGAPLPNPSIPELWPAKAPSGPTRPDKAPPPVVQPNRPAF